MTGLNSKFSFFKQRLGLNNSLYSQNICSNLIMQNIIDKTSVLVINRNSNKNILENLFGMLLVPTITNISKKSQHHLIFIANYATLKISKYKPGSSFKLHLGILPDFTNKLVYYQY